MRTGSPVLVTAFGGRIDRIGEESFIHRRRRNKRKRKQMSSETLGPTKERDIHMIYVAKEENVA